jgi:membrane associated rhomboid family serine protease
MIPLADENPLRHKAWATTALIALCVFAYLAVQPAGRNTFRVTDPRVQWEDLQFSIEWATVPCEIIEGRSLTQAEFDATFTSENGSGSACRTSGNNTPINPNKVVWLGLMISMFLHGGVAHLFGNMLYLWVFGNNIEDSRGRWAFLALYLVGGIIADFTHIAVDPNSTVPIVGASGAIAAVMGAYLALYPKVRIKVITPWMGLRKISAGWVLGLWVVQQFAIMGSDSGVSWGAHLGGFAVGVLVGQWWRRSDRRRLAKLVIPAAPGGPGIPGALSVTSGALSVTPSYWPAP